MNTKYVLSCTSSDNAFRKKGVIIGKYIQYNDGTWHDEENHSFLNNNEMLDYDEDHYSQRVFDSMEEAEIFKNGTLYGMKLASQSINSLIS